MRIAMITVLSAALMSPLIGGCTTAHEESPVDQPLHWNQDDQGRNHHGEPGQRSISDHRYGQQVQSEHRQFVEFNRNEVSNSPIHRLFCECHGGNHLVPPRHFTWLQQSQIVLRFFFRSARISADRRGFLSPPSR